MHRCPKCKKNWKCITEMLNDELLDGKGTCDMPKKSMCYDCMKMPEMYGIKDEIQKAIIVKRIAERHAHMR